MEIQRSTGFLLGLLVKAEHKTSDLPTVGYWELPNISDPKLVLRIELIMSNTELPYGLSKMTYKVLGTMPSSIHGRY